MLALQAYVSSGKELTIPDLRKLPGLTNVGDYTLHNWKDRDQWVQRREEFQKAVFKQFVDVAAGRLAQSYAQVLDDLGPLEQRLFDTLNTLSADKLQGEEPAKLVTAYLKVQAARLEYAAQAARILTPQPSVGGAPNAQVTEAAAAEEAPMFTVEESRVAAEAVLRHRNAVRAASLSPPAVAAPPVHK